MTKQKRCVVLGGSFNPATKAHKILMETAIKHLNADNAVYVPSSDAYVRRKNAKTGTTTLSETDRMRILMEMCLTSTCTSVSTCEFGDETKGRTIQTLEEIQKIYPNHQIWFIMGADKIPVFHKWPARKKILSDFYILWIDRDENSAEAAALASPFLREHMDHQDFMGEPKGADGISSSQFWKLLHTDPTKAMTLLDPSLKKPIPYFLK